jgi:hypothetical protein
VGFQPKAYILFYTKNATDDTDSIAGESLLSVGMTDGTTQFCMASGTEHNQATSDVGRRGFSDMDAVLASHDAQSNQIVDGEASHVSLDADGFTINITNDFTDPANPIVHYIAFGGAGLSVDVNTVDLADAIDTAVDVTAPGFEPDVVITSYIGYFLDVDADTNNDDHSFSLGWAVNPARQATNNQYSMMVASQDNVSPSNSISRFDDTRAGTSFRDGSIDAGYEIGSFDASGFSVTTRLAGATTNETMGYLALKLGSDPKVYSTARTARTTIGDDVESGAGFQPNFLFGVGSAAVTAANTNTAGCSMAIGFTDGTNTYALMQHDQDAVTLTNTHNRVTNSQFMSANAHGGAIDWEATFSSFDASGWTINYGDAATAAFQNAFLAIGTNSAPNSPTIDTHNDGSWTSDNTPTLGFTQSDPEAAEQVQYRIQIDATDNTFSNLVVDYISDFMAEGAASFTVGQAVGSGTYTVGSQGQSLSDGDYYWRVMSIDDESAESPWATANSGSIAFKVDATPPTAPGNLTLNSTDSSSITLNFGSQTIETNFDTYKIFYKKGSSGVGETDTEHTDANLGFIDYNSATTTTINSLSANTQYVINIWAYDLAGNKASATEMTVTTDENPWYNTDWQYRKHLRIDSSRVAGDLNYFPVLINTTDADWIEDSEPTPGHVAQTDGGDILFTASDGTTKLDHEIENYDPTTGQLIAWVEVPTLSGSIDTGLYIYYGNTVLLDSENQWNVNGTWDEDGSNNYKGVWHLKETSGTQYDSTQSGNDGTASVTTHGSAPGKINGADGFSGTLDRVEVGTSNWSVSQGTLELWGYPTATTYSRYFFGHTTQPPFNNRIQLFTDDTSGNLDLGLGDNHYRHVDIQALTPNTWYHIVLTWDGTNYIVYVDGVPKANGSYTGLTALHTFADIGNDGDPLTRNEGFNGIIDEVRISGVARTPEWIQTEYNNQKAPAAFYTVGIEETPGAGADPFNNGWQYSKKITILASEVTADLTNFPVLINTTHADWIEDSQPTPGDVAQLDGGDILFMAGDRTTKLDHEIESYNETTGKLVAWVEVPSLSDTQDTDIYIFYGNANAVDQWNPTGAGVWEPNYAGVWHLHETSGDHADSTWNNNTGIPNGGVNQNGTGQMNGADTFDATDDYLEPTTTGFSTQATTIDFWIKPNWNGNDGVNHRLYVNEQTLYDWDTNAIYIQKKDDNELEFIVADDSATDYRILETDVSGWVAGEWHHVVVSWDSALTLKMYLDGSDVTPTPSDVGTPGLPTALGPAFTMGGYPGAGGELDGVLDEVRVSRVARSAAWIETAHNNQKTGSTFYVIDDDWVGPCWDANYAYRKKIAITAGSADIPSGYSVFFTEDTATLITDNKVRSDGNDWRIVYWDGSSWVELDRWVDDIIGDGWNTTNTVTWFKTQAAISASTSDGNYYVHYGYSGQTQAAPASMSDSMGADAASNVFWYADDFEEHASGADPDGWTDQGAEDFQVALHGSEKWLQAQTRTLWDDGSTASGMNNIGDAVWSSKIYYHQLGTQGWGGIGVHTDNGGVGYIVVVQDQAWYRADESWSIVSGWQTNTDIHFPVGTQGRIELITHGTTLDAYWYNPSGYSPEKVTLFTGFTISAGTGKLAVYVERPDGAIPTQARWAGRRKAAAENPRPLAFSPLRPRARGVRSWWSGRRPKRSRMPALTSTVRKARWGPLQGSMKG